MYYTRRAVPAALLAAALATGAVSCGTSASKTGARAAEVTPKATASRDSLAGLTADQIAAKALADTEAATSVHITGTGTDSGQTMTFDLTLVPGKGCRGSVVEPKKGSVKLIYLGKKVWVMPNQAFYKSFVGTDPATLSFLSGKWLEDKAGGSGLGGLISMCTLSKLLSIINSPVGLAKGPTATISGQRAVKITDTGDSAYAYVSDAARPALIRVVDPGSGGGNLELTDYDTPVTITAPPASKVLDGSKYGF